MTIRILAVLTMPLALHLWGTVVPEELVRRGNAAYERQDFGTATAVYTEAAARITDPGLTAFNKAAALYRRGLYRDAELHYRCCLEDATGLRRTHALYGLGNALLQQGHDRGADVLREAIRRFEECMRQEALDADLLDDARHNLELAKLLLLQVPPKSKDTPESRQDEIENQPRPQDRQDDSASGLDPNGMGAMDPRGERRRLDRQLGQNTSQTDESSPGASKQLPPIPDQEQMAPLTREDAENHLKHAAARILSEHRAHQHQRRSKGTSSNALDW
jgi:tetratricopeptide (TPR) repeat protein